MRDTGFEQVARFNASAGLRACLTFPDKFLTNRA